MEEGAKMKNDRVASPKRVPIHLRNFSQNFGLSGGFISGRFYCYQGWVEYK